MRLSILLLGLLALLAATPAAAQAGPPNGVLLVAKPGLADPRFRDTVVLATQTPDFSTVGVILNRPTQSKLAQFMPGAAAQQYEGTVYFGGPVLERTLIALFASGETPERAVFHVHRNVYLGMHPDVLERALSFPPAKVRFFAGFAGWAPRQLQAELERNDWHVLPVTEEVLFRNNPSGLWEELLERARARDAAKRAALYWVP